MELEPGESQETLTDSAGQQSIVGASVATQVVSVVLVVVLGCANNISKQIAAKPLSHYSYMLSLATAVAYVPLYAAVLLVVLRAGWAPKFQLSFIWRGGLSHLPNIIFIGSAALGDTLGDVIGMICTPYVSGPVHSLLSNCTPVFIAGLAFCVLGQRYSLLQVSSLCGVFVAVIIGVLPSFEDADSKVTRPFFATVLGASCIFNAIAFVIKDLLFGRYRQWLVQENLEDAGGLHVFVMNTHLAIFQLPFTLLTVPLNTAFGQTYGKGIFVYVREAFACVFDGSCGPNSYHGEVAGLWTLIYVVFNIAWNVSILFSVKHSGALTTFVALKAIFPVSTLLFAYVDWPLLRRTPLSWLVWLAVVLLLPCVAIYQRASYWQACRAEKRPSQALCCWPVGSQRTGISR